MPDTDVTELLNDATLGAPDAAAKLFPLVYSQLKLMAARQLRGERRDHTLSATALVHEAFLKLVPGKHVTWESQAHFYRTAAQAMRRILVDHARRRGAGKRKRDRQVTLDPEAPLAANSASDEVVAVDEALIALSNEDPRAARVVELRYFGGHSLEEAAALLGISVATAKRDWRAARAWLQRALG